MAHVCPWWGGYFIDNPLRRWLHNPERILGAYVRPGMTVMDVGCGMGIFSLALAQLVGPGGRVIAIDLQPQMLRVVARRARAAGVTDRITLHRCAATSLGMSTSVDFALAFYSAHEVPDVPHLLREIHACVRPRGELLVVEPHGHVSAHDFARMLADAEEIGWHIQERPSIRWSHAAVLARSGDAGPGEA